MGVDLGVDLDWLQAFIGKHWRTLPATVSRGLGSSDEASPHTLDTALLFRCGLLSDTMMTG
jgi:hypothetical protein